MQHSTTVRQSNNDDNRANIVNFNNLRLSLRQLEGAKLLNIFRDSSEKIWISKHTRLEKIPNKTLVAGGCKPVLESVTLTPSTQHQSP